MSKDCQTSTALTLISIAEDNVDLFFVVDPTLKYGELKFNNAKSTRIEVAVLKSVL
jgi:hypothetical protein